MRKYRKRSVSSIYTWMRILKLFIFLFLCLGKSGCGKYTSKVASVERNLVEDKNSPKSVYQKEVAVFSYADGTYKVKSSKWKPLKK